MKSQADTASFFIVGWIIMKFKKLVCIMLAGLFASMAIACNTNANVSNSNDSKSEEEMETSLPIETLE